MCFIYIQINIDMVFVFASILLRAVYFEMIAEIKMSI